MTSYQKDMLLASAAQVGGIFVLAAMAGSLTVAPNPQIQPAPGRVITESEMQQHAVRDAQIKTLLVTAGVAAAVAALPILLNNLSEPKSISR